MNKENSNDKVNFYKKQAENQRQADIITRQQQQNQEKETQERVRRTKENFARTGILETFQEIIDKRVLICGHEEKKTKGFFGYKSESVVQPAFIEYESEKIILNFNSGYHAGGDHNDGYYGYDNITIEKIDSTNYKFTVYKQYRPKGTGISYPQFGNNQRTTENIAKFVADPYSLQYQ